MRIHLVNPSDVVLSKYPPSVALAVCGGVFTLLRVESGHRQGQ
jgi:hypothetical protein